MPPPIHHPHWNLVHLPERDDALLQHIPRSLRPSNRKDNEINPQGRISATHITKSLQHTSQGLSDLPIGEINPQGRMNATHITKSLGSSHRKDNDFMPSDGLILRGPAHKICCMIKKIRRSFESFHLKDHTGHQQVVSSIYLKSDQATRILCI